MNIQLLNAINMVKRALDNDPIGIIYGESKAGGDSDKKSIYLNLK